MDFKTLHKVSKVLQKFGVNLQSLKFGEIKTADGSATLVYKGDNVMAGEPLFIVTDEGELPAPDGKHELEDGRMVVIEGGQGVVTEVIEAGTETEVEVEAPAANPSEAAAPVLSQEPMSSEEIERTITERIKKFEDEITAKHQAEIEAMKNKFNAEKKELNDALLEVADLYEKEKEKPATAPAQPVKKKQPFAVQPKKSAFDNWYNKLKK